MELDLYKQYSETGCIFIPRILTPQRVGRLRLICEHVLAQWRLCNPETGKPGCGFSDAIAMRHLNHPGYFPGRRDWLVEILETAADPRVLGVVREIFGEEPLFRCTSLFMNPLVESSEGNWHRDSQFVTPDKEADDAMVLTEAERINRGGHVAGVQLQIALVPSEDSEYVPGSHLRLDTPEEHFIRLADGHKHNRSNLMPGAVRTHQEPGDAAAFHANGLHRGRYHADKCRRTLMLTYTTAAHTPRDYFSMQPWCLQPGYLDGVTPATRAFFERFIAVFRDFWEKPPATA